MSAVGKREWQSSALVSPTTILNRDAAPIGDDIEQDGETRADVEGRGVGGQHRIELFEEAERERTTPIVAFDYGFL